MLEPGTKIGPYEIVAPLGAGGMGEVYRAHDDRLGREVAVKVLPERLSHDPDRLRRFEREARAAAVLGHPNILAVYDVGTHDGQPYIVTELLDGQTLRELIKEGLTVGKAVELAVEIANGLAAAHERGVVHRDLKPTNVLVTRAGVVKILDFGLAKLTETGLSADEVTEAPTEEPATGSGAIIGTAGYMAPEQVRGRAADHRADVFAFGCVLYEMLSGQRAFRADTAADTAAAILSRDPPSLAGSERPVPHALERIVKRCLEKRPDDRFQSARDVAFALQAAGTSLSESQAVVGAAPAKRSIALRIPLRVVLIVAAILLLAGAIQMARRWTATPPLPPVKHVAVMGFQANGDVATLQPIADGLTEVVANGLSLVEQGASDGFWIVPRREARDLGVKTAGDMARKFNATVVVTGRLERSDNRLRLTLAAVEAGSGRTLRQAVIEDSAGNVSSFQDGPVVRLAAMLQVALSPGMRQRLVASATTMPAAFDAYLHGRSLLAAASSRDDIGRAIATLLRSVAADPLYAAGWTALAQACVEGFAFDKDAKWIDRGLAYAGRGEVLHGRPEQAWRAAAALHMAAGQMEDAAAELETAAREAPNDAEVLVDLAAVYQSAHRFGDAERALRRAVFLRPGYWVGHDRLAKVYSGQGMYEAAATEFRHVIDCAPHYALGYVALGSMLCFLERTEECRRLFERSVEVEPTYHGLSNLGTLYFNDSRFADAAAMYQRALDVDDSDYELWGNLALAQRFGAAPETADATFRRALRMGEERLRDSPDDPRVLTNLADYLAMLHERPKGLDLIDRVVASHPTDPQSIANVAEVLWDLDDQDRALEWVRRAFDAGIPRSHFEGRPALRDLVADERYRALVQNTADATSAPRGDKP